MIEKQPPASLTLPDGWLDPLIFQAIIHGGDLAALHPTIIGEWHPSVRVKLHEWIDLGHTGNPSNFNDMLMNLFNMEVCSTYIFVVFHINNSICRHHHLTREIYLPIITMVWNFFSKWCLGPLALIIQNTKHLFMVFVFLVAMALIL
jgi:hypothetical protein